MGLTTRGTRTRIREVVDLWRTAAPVRETLGRWMQLRMFEKIRRWARRRKYCEGKTLSQFIARDVRRDILIVSAARIDEGIIRGRVRTSNVLYVSKGLVSQPDFEPATELHIDQMWHWTGQSWGGLPDGTSIVDHQSGKQSD